jgi:hypothetical protein
MAKTDEHRMRGDKKEVRIKLNHGRKEVTKAGKSPST